MAKRVDIIEQAPEFMKLSLLDLIMFDATKHYFHGKAVILQHAGAKKRAYFIKK